MNFNQAFGKTITESPTLKNDPKIKKQQAKMQEQYQLEKMGYMDQTNRDVVTRNLPGAYMNQENENFGTRRVGTDSFLRYPSTQYKTKGKFEGTFGEFQGNTFDEKYNGYGIKMNLAQEQKDLKYLQAEPYRGSGKGQGNCDVANVLQFGHSSRNDQKHMLGGVEINRFQYLDRDFQNPNNIVLPFPRGGIDTRNLNKYSRKNL